MRLSVIALISLLIVSNTCAGWLTFGGKIHSDTTDTVTGVQSQQLVNVESGLTAVSPYTNGAALGATALQPAATNTLAAAAAHAATAHGVTPDGGFQGGSEYTYAESGGAVGYGAYTTYGGAVGSSAYTTYGGAVGAGAYAESGGAVGSGAYTIDGGAVGWAAKTSDGFAGGKGAFATTDGTWNTDGIDAIQLGTGSNTEPFTLQVYGNRLLNADGTIPVERLTLHNTNGLAHADIRALIPTLPGPGCTELGYAADGTNVTITGATYSYFFAPDKAYTLSVAPDAPRYHYSIEIIGDHACTLPVGHRLRGKWTITGTNEVVVAPSTGTVWNVFGRGL